MWGDFTRSGKIVEREFARVINSQVIQVEFFCLSKKVKLLHKLFYLYSVGNAGIIEVGEINYFPKKRVEIT